MSTASQPATSHWSPAEAQTLSYFEDIVAMHRRTIGRKMALVLLISVAFLYAVPVIVQFELMRFFGSWVTCVLLADLCGSVVLFMLGRKQLALATYAISSAVEATLLASGRITPQHLLLLTNVLPALACTVVFARSFRAASCQCGMVRGRPYVTLPSDSAYV